MFNLIFDELDFSSRNVLLHQKLGLTFSGGHLLIFLVPTNFETVPMGLVRFLFMHENQSVAHFPG